MALGRTQTGLVLLQDTVVWLSLQQFQVLFGPHATPLSVHGMKLLPLVQLRALTPQVALGAISQFVPVYPHVQEK